MDKTYVICILKLGKPFEDMEWRLFVSITDSDIRNLPYDRHAAKTGRGWYFAKSDYDLSVQEIKISIPSAPESTVIFPVPTTWVVVYGSADELSPQAFIFDRVELDGSLHDQEELRKQIVLDFTNINMISRLYEDEIDLSPSDIAEARLEHLTETRLRDSLNLNQHILSLS